jgi:autophagy-related protein 5
MELRRKLWDGLLPVKVDLAINDLSSIETPRSLYIMAPRENYLFFILNEVKWLFDSYGPAEKLDSYDEMWFEFNNIPLKWNVPIGVQFDTIVGLSDKHKDLPWCLTFHYRGFPEEQVLRLEGMNCFKFFFINSLKES